MTKITMQEAQETLPELVHRLSPGEAMQITENGQPVAVVMATPRPNGPGEPRKLGGQAGSVLYMAPDFDAPLEDFKEYME
jgi:antitoxin (DNA-binding transcriptional repressor) of toxin-antitoxin stability system